MAICSIPDCADHYACRMRAKGVRVSTEATPTRVANRPQPYRPMAEPSWEKGVAGEHRPGGTFMPYLNENREEMGVHEHASKRHEVQDAVHRLRNDPTVFDSAGG